MKFLCLSAVFFFVLVSFTFAAGTNIPACNDTAAVINSPDLYVVDTDLVGAPNLHPSSFNACILINSSDVIVDCQGFSITDNGTSNSVGILAYRSPSVRLSNITVRNCPNVSGYKYNIAFDYVDNSVITNVSASNATSDSILLVSTTNTSVSYANSSTSPNGIVLTFSSSNNSVSNSVASNNSNSGIVVDLYSTMNNLTNNFVLNNSPYGIVIDQTDQTNIFNNTINLSTYGVFLNRSNFTNVSGNYVDSSSNAMYVLAATNNSISNNTLRNNTYGVETVFSSNTSVVDNNGYNNTNAIYINGGSWNNVSSNTLFSNTYGIAVIGSSSNNTLERNVVYDNFEGILLSTVSNNSVINNTAHTNSNYGIATNLATYSILRDNIVYGNGNSSVVSGGIYLFDSNGTTVSNEHLYNNTQDIVFNTTFFVQTLNLSSIVLDNPAGDFSNYTNLSLFDFIPFNEAYSVSWIGNTSSLPAAYTSVNGTYINVTNYSNSWNISQLSFNWLDGNLAGQDENEFSILLYNGTWFGADINRSTSLNTVSVTEINFSGIYSLVEYHTTNPPVSSGGSSSTPSLRVSLDMQCNNNTITTNVGSVSVNVVDEDSGSLVYSGTTDSGGEAQFASCGRTVRVYANRDGYRSTDERFVLDSCTCLGTTENPSPPVPAPVPTPSPTPTPQVNNTTPEPSPIPQPTPGTPSFTGPSSGTVGSSLTFSVTNCDGCTVRVEGPDGRTTTLTVTNGQVSVPVIMPGNYRLSLVRNGEVVSSLSMAAMGNNTSPTPTPSLQPTPESPSGDNGMGFAVMIIIILTIIGGGVAYYYMQRRK